MATDDGDSKWDLLIFKCFMATYRAENHCISVLLYLVRQIFYTSAHFTVEETDSQGHVRSHVRACSVAQSCSTLLTPWTVAQQALLSIGFCRQEYWSGLPFLFPGDLPNPGIKPKSPASPALVGRFFITGPPGKPVKSHTACQSSSRKLWQHSIYKGRRVRHWGFSLPPSDDSQAVLSLFQLNPECLHLSFQEIFCVVYLTLLEYRYSERRPKNQKKKDFSKNFCKKHESLAFRRSLQ